MKKLLTLILLLLIVVCANVALAQDELMAARIKNTKRDTKVFDIITLDSKAAKVKIIPDYVHGILKIGYLKDTIKAHDFWMLSPESFYFLNKNFIGINYEVRGGTNLGLGNTLVVCVSSGKLYEAMHVLKYAHWEEDILKNDYNIKPILEGNNKNNYKLNVRIHDDVDSKNHPKWNYAYNNQTVLAFDTNENAFYSIKANTYRYSIITKTEKPPKKTVDSNALVIILGKETYYFVKNKWYQLGDMNKLNEM